MFCHIFTLVREVWLRIATNWVVFGTGLAISVYVTNWIVNPISQMVSWVFLMLTWVTLSHGLWLVVASVFDEGARDVARDNFITPIYDEFILPLMASAMNLYQAVDAYRLQKPAGKKAVGQKTAGKKADQGAPRGQRAKSPGGQGVRKSPARRR